MENQKSNKGAIAVLIIIIIILLAVVALMATGTISFKSSTKDTSNQNNSTESSNNSSVSNNDFTISADELSKFGKADYNIIKGDYDSNYSFNLLSDGRININFEHYINNISNAKDIKLFSSQSSDSTLYILTLNGDIYQYETLGYKSGNYNATKVDKYSNIKQMITYQTRKANAGGCDYIILIDNNGKYYELSSFCA